MSRRPDRKPRRPTRERRLYVASSREYALAFREVFRDPLAARRAFRNVVAQSGDEEAVSQLGYAAEQFGECWPSAMAIGATDPAFIYWTQRERRPRALLIEAATTIYTELQHRRAIDRLAAAQASAHDRGNAYELVRAPREAARDRVREVVDWAGYVYVEPRSACRRLVRSVRRHGMVATCQRLEARPEAFGLLAKGPDSWVGLFPTTQDARKQVPKLVQAVTAALVARAKRAKPGKVLRAKQQFDAARAAVAAAKYPSPVPVGALKEAGRVIAVLYRRRAVDEQPRTGQRRPTIERQLAAMLPADAALLIREAIRLSAKESGEDPVWIRELGSELELGRQLELSRTSRARDKGGIGFEM